MQRWLILCKLSRHLRGLVFDIKRGAQFSSTESPLKCSAVQCRRFQSRVFTFDAIAGYSKTGWSLSHYELDLVSLAFFKRSWWSQILTPPPSLQWTWLPSRELQVDCRQNSVDRCFHQLLVTKRVAAQHSNQSVLKFCRTAISSTFRSDFWQSIKSLSLYHKFTSRWRITFSFSKEAHRNSNLQIPPFLHLGLLIYLSLSPFVTRISSILPRLLLTPDTTPWLLRCAQLPPYPTHRAPVSTNDSTSLAPRAPRAYSNRLRRWQSTAIALS